MVLPRGRLLETRLVPKVTIEDYLRALSNEKNGIEVSEKEWKRFRASSVYKFIEKMHFPKKI